MKNCIIKLLIITCLLFNTGCTQEAPATNNAYKSIVDYSAENLDIVNSEGDLEGPKRNFKDISEYANVVIKATIIGNYEEIPQYDEKGILLIADTKVDIRVDEVYKDCSSSINKGDVLKLIESYFIVNETYSDGTSADVLVTIDNYLPSVEGEEYVLYLNEAYSGEDEEYLFYDMYYPVSLSYGRYKLSDSTKKGVEFTFLNDYRINHKDDGIYQEVFDEVLKTYSLELNN